MFSGFFFNLLIANLILHKLGGIFFSNYAAITSIPLLLSFLDLSLGQVVYNILTDRSKPNWEQQVKTYISRVFYTLIIISFLLCFVTLTISYPLNFSQQFDLSSDQNLNALLPINLILYFLSIPLNIGFRILSALSKVNAIIWIQSLMYPITFFGSFFFLNSNRNMNAIIFILPALATFLVSLMGFLKAFTWRYLVKIETKGLGKWFKQEAIPVAFWSTLLSSLSMLIIHFPRFYLLKYGDTQSAVSYNYFLLFLLPGHSLIVTYCSVSGPKFRLKNSYQEKIVHLHHARVDVITMSLVIGGFLIITSMLGLSNFVHYLNLGEAKYIWISLILYGLWFIPISSLTEAKSAKQFTFDFLFGGVLIIGMLSIFHPSTFADFVEQVYLPANLFISIKVLNSQFRLIKSEHFKREIHDS